MATVNLTQDPFAAPVLNNDTVLIDFWAEWCGPCRSFAPVYEKLSEEHPEIVFGKVDTEAEQELAGHFQIRSIPTLMAFRESIGVFSQPGALPEDVLADLISQITALDMEEVRKEIADHDHGEHDADHDHDHEEAVKESVE